MCAAAATVNVRTQEAIEVLAVAPAGAAGGAWVSCRGRGFPATRNRCAARGARELLRVVDGLLRISMGFFYGLLMDCYGLLKDCYWLLMDCYVLLIDCYG